MGLSIAIPACICLNPTGRAAPWFEIESTVTLCFRSYVTLVTLLCKFSFHLTMLYEVLLNEHMEILTIRFVDARSAGQSPTFLRHFLKG